MLSSSSGGLEPGKNSSRKSSTGIGPRYDPGSFISQVALSLSFETLEPLEDSVIVARSLRLTGVP